MTNKLAKTLLLLVTCLSPHFSWCQNEPKEEVFTKYSEATALKDYTKALRLENADSLDEAIRFYRYVALYSPEPYFSALSKKRLQQIWKDEKLAFQQLLEGKWRWMSSGTNWGVSDSPKICKCSRYIEFKGDSISFYEGNTLTETLPYYINFEIRFIGTDQVMVYIADGRKIWRLSITPEVENAYFLAERSKNAEFFLEMTDVGLLPNCVCGCPEMRFER